MKIFYLLYNFFIRVFSGLIPDREKRRNFRTKHTLNKKGMSLAPSFISKHSGIIYYPNYSKGVVQDSTEYIIYDAQGIPMRTFFLRDDKFSNIPASYQSTRFLFDRYNYGLKVHFYTHKMMLETIGNPQKRYGMFIEPESIAPEDYAIFDQNKGLEKDFDLIFTHTERFLEKFDNARLFSLCAATWNILSDENGNLPQNWKELKTKGISVLSSDKIMCPLHKFRLELAKKCKKEGLADTFGTFDGGKFVPVSETLNNYKYSIAVENEVSAYWFTEKILNCFGSLTIPIYIGAAKIDKFFNPDGIIRIKDSDFDNIDKILKNCTEEEYYNRSSAVIENYYKAKEYSNSGDLLYTKYLENDLK